MKVPSGTHAMRRGGARREVSSRVTMRPLQGGDATHEGWALNVSRGGLRAILEEAKVALGDEFEITMGDGDELPPRTGRVVWLQEEPDGVIIGIEFTSLSGTHKSVPPAPPGSTRLPGIVAESDIPPPRDPEDA